MSNFLKWILYLPVSFGFGLIIRVIFGFLTDILSKNIKVRIDSGEDSYYLIFCTIVLLALIAIMHALVSFIFTFVAVKIVPSFKKRVAFIQMCLVAVISIFYVVSNYQNIIAMLFCSLVSVFTSYKIYQSVLPSE